MPRIELRDGEHVALGAFEPRRLADSGYRNAVYYPKPRPVVLFKLNTSDSSRRR